MSSEPAIHSPSLIWVFTDSLADQLDAVSWLEPTNFLRRQGWDVSLITAGPARQTEIKGVPVTAIQKPDIYLLRQAIFHLRVLRYIAGLWSETDIVLFHQMSAPWLLPIRVIRFLRRRPFPIVIMDTRTAPMIPSEAATRKDRLRTKFDNLMNRIANPTADGQTAITKRMADMMGIPDAKLLGVWPSGVFLERFAPAREKRNWEGIEEELHLVYIGALHVQRNLMNFCQAVELANETGKCFKFTMVGWGTDRENLAEFAAGTDGRVQVLQPIPHDQIPDLLARAHLGVLPFPDQERFRVSSPIKLFEYMASGLPILATKIVCHTDVIGGGQYAYWAEGADPQSFLVALNQIWEGRRTLPEMSALAGHAAEDWTWEATSGKLEEALRKGMSRKTARAN